MGNGIISDEQLKEASKRLHALPAGKRKRVLKLVNLMSPDRGFQNRFRGSDLFRLSGMSEADYHEAMEFLHSTGALRKDTPDNN